MLQFAELTEVFPSWSTPSNEFTRLPELAHFYKNEPLIKDINSKFRVKNGKLQVDNRSFQSIYRKISGDSRWKILEIIKSLVNTYSFHQDIIKIVIIMYNGCYKNDKKWKKALNEIIPERYIEILMDNNLPISDYPARSFYTYRDIGLSPMTSGKQVVPLTRDQLVEIAEDTSKLRETVKTKTEDNTEAPPPYTVMVSFNLKK